MNLKFIFLLFLIFFISKSFADEDPIVDTIYGKLQGFVLDLGDGKKADIFLNIPFARPPVGELRYEKPHPPEPWQGIRQAKTWGSICYPHLLVEEWTRNVNVSEDCLQLNVFRPHKPSTSPDGYPVLVWVHGGGYSVGSAVTSGYEGVSKNFVSRGLIVISIQYRLGPLGWSSTGDEAIPGNLGYWDQAEALHWVHENIKYFGGDSNRVTVWGISAGGSSVSALSMSPHTRDYISATIEMSGSMFAPWAGSDDVVGVTKDYIKVLGCDQQEAQEVKKCLKTKSIEEILDSIKTIGPARRDLNMIKFHPRVDGDFFPEDFVELIKKSPPKPAIIGFTNIESALFTFVMGDMPPLLTDVGIPKSQYPTFGLQNLTSYIQNHVVKKSELGTEHQEVVENLLNFYANHQKAENPDYKFYLEKYNQLLTDAQFIIPGLLTAEYKRRQDWPVYLYQFEHVSEKNSDPSLPVKGFLHGGETPYLFGHNFFGPFTWDENELNVREVLVETMTNFVKTGNPSMTSLEWPKLTEYHPRRYMSLKTQSHLKDEDLLEKRWNFWKDIMQNYSFDIVRRQYNKGFDAKHSEL